jgi:hypothetical protein
MRVRVVSVRARAAFLVAGAVSGRPALAVCVRVDAGRRLSIGALFDIAADGDEEPLRDERNLGDRGLERLGVPLRRLLEAGHLAHELARGRFDFTRGGWIVVVT